MKKFIDAACIVNLISASINIATLPKVERTPKRNWSPTSPLNLCTKSDQDVHNEAGQDEHGDEQDASEDEDEFFDNDDDEESNNECERIPSSDSTDDSEAGKF